MPRFGDEAFCASVEAGQYQHQLPAPAPVHVAQLGRQRRRRIMAKELEEIAHLVLLPWPRWRARGFLALSPPCVSKKNPTSPRIIVALSRRGRDAASGRHGGENIKMTGRGRARIRRRLSLYSPHLSWGDKSDPGRPPMSRCL